MELASNLTFQSFSNLLSILFKLLPTEKCKKYIVEVPFDVINRLKKYMVDNKMLPNYYRFYINNLSIGSIVNLSKYYIHYAIPKNVETKNLPIIMECKFTQKFMAIYFYLDTNKRA